MLKLKKILLLVTLSIGLVSCGEFTKVLNKGTSADQYNLATKYYEQGKYAKSLQLFEEILPDFQGKPQLERIQFMIADATYRTKDYLTAAYYFDRFVKNYPKSTKREDASYLAAMSYYLSTPRASLDQSDTQTAINSFQKYIDSYPESEKISQANNYIKEMQNKLETKAFNIAYQYYHTSQYNAAIVAFDNFLSDNLGTHYKEDALYYKSLAAHDLAINSVLSKKAERIDNALQYISRLERNFKESKYIAEIEKMKKKLHEEMDKIKV